MVTFPTRIPDSGSQSPALLDLFISSDAAVVSISSLETFQQIQNGMPRFTA